MGPPKAVRPSLRKARKTSAGVPEVLDGSSSCPVIGGPLLFEAMCATGGAD
jgi:hypothetical protein